MAQQYPPPGYYYPPPPVAAASTSGWAIFSLIAGILAWLGVFGLGGLAAVIAGHIAKSQINNSAGRVTGSGMATAGLVLGYVNIALTVFGLCLALLVFAGAITAPLMCMPFANQYNGY
jgi:hypothetical protein